MTQSTPAGPHQFTLTQSPYVPFLTSKYLFLTGAPEINEKKKKEVSASAEDAPIYSSNLCSWFS